MITYKILTWILSCAIIILCIIFAIYVYKYKNTPSQQMLTQQQQLNWANCITYVAGFKYDYKKNIFTSRQDALQRLGGYNDTYDDLSTILYMVIDIEPIVFNYNGVNYMIELWKGQYCAAAGCEIGFYIASKGRPGRFYCAPDNMMLDMSYNLRKIDTKEILFNQSGVHWWLTGFKPGVFAQPENLSLENIKIKFPEEGMAKAFFNALTTYFNNQQEYQYLITGNTVSFRWHITKFSPQPNFTLRSKYQEYNLNIVNNLNNIMTGNYTPEAINNKLIEFITFLNTNDNVDELLDWLFKDIPEDNLLKIVQDYDKAHGNNNINNMMIIIAYIKNWYGPGFKSMSWIGKMVCRLYPSYPICKFIVNS
jgi:hypothetical protein